MMRLKDAELAACTGIDKAAAGTAGLAGNTGKCIVQGRLLVQALTELQRQS